VDQRQEGTIATNKEGKPGKNIGTFYAIREGENGNPIRRGFGKTTQKSKSGEMGRGGESKTS